MIGMVGEVELNNILTSNIFPIVDASVQDEPTVQMMKANLELL
jgi:hypothetical protein